MSITTSTNTSSGIAGTAPNLVMLRTVEAYRRIPVEYLAALVGRPVGEVRRDLEVFRREGLVTIEADDTVRRTTAAQRASDG
jgi:predicted transcriptional regulator